MLKNLRRKALSLLLLFILLVSSHQASAMGGGRYGPDDWFPYDRSSSPYSERRKAPEAPRETELNEAISDGKKRRVRELLQTPGIDVNAKGATGDRPLHLAVRMGYEAIVMLLLNLKDQQGRQLVEINAANAQEDTPLHVAGVKYNEDVIKLLLLAGADPRVLNNASGLSPVHTAVLNSYIIFLKQLFLIAKENNLENGVNALTSGGKTPLMLAMMRGYEKIAELLLGNGANVNMVFWSQKRSATSSGQTALDIARNLKFKNKENLVSLLLRHGALTAREVHHSKCIPAQPKPVEAPKSVGESRAVQRKKKARQKKQASLALSSSTGNLRTQPSLVNSAVLDLRASLCDLRLSQD